MCRKPITFSELKSGKHCVMSLLPNKDSNCLKCSYYTSHVFNKDDTQSRYYSEKVYTENIIRK